MVQTAPPPHTVAAVIALIVCWPFGIPALVAASRSKQRWLAGDAAGASQASSRAMLWSVIAWIAAPIILVVGGTLLAIAAIGYNQTVSDARVDSAFTQQVQISSAQLSAEMALSGQVPSESGALSMVNSADHAGLVFSPGASATDGRIRVASTTQALDHSCLVLPDSPGAPVDIEPSWLHC